MIPVINKSQLSEQAIKSKRFGKQWVLCLESEIYVGVSSILSYSFLEEN